MSACTCLPAPYPMIEMQWDSRCPRHGLREALRAERPAKVHTFTVEIHGEPRAFEAAFPPVPSSAADDQGMTIHEVCADWVAWCLEVGRQLLILGSTVSEAAASLQVVVRP